MGVSPTGNKAATLEKGTSNKDKFSND